MEQSDRAKQMQRQRSQRTPEEKERDRERDRQRKSKTPVSSRPAVQDPSGLYLPPVGRKRIGKRWNGVIGEWVDEQLPITADEQERTSQLNAERVVKQQAQTTLGQLRTAVLLHATVPSSSGPAHMLAKFEPAARSWAQMPSGSGAPKRILSEQPLSTSPYKPPRTSPRSRIEPL